VSWYPQLSDPDLELGAIQALEILSKQGVHAIPELSRYATSHSNDKSDRCLGGVIHALACSGPAAAPLVLSLTTATNSKVRFLSASYCWKFGSNEMVVQHLTSLLKDPDRNVRRSAEFSLDRIKNRSPIND
jgi:hypothetical protein